MSKVEPLGGGMSLAGRHALVCGASAGIGRASALALASLGARVTVLARRAEVLQSLLPQLRDAGAADAHAIAADQEDRAGLGAIVTAWIAAHGPVHVLVNNTGGPPGGAALDAEAEQFERALGRILLAAQLLTRSCLPGMRDAGFGRIVNILSTSVREPIPNLAVGNTMRAAMGGWTKTLANELPPGVTINNVLPGYTSTERLAELAKATAARTGRSLADVEADWKREIPEGRFASPSEIGNAVAFLCSPAAGYIRGVSLAVDGGRMRGI
jgi:3-oxoacyl-[acyl-carrier protein] reductase